MDKEQFRLKREQFRKDMHILSEEKTKQLFETSEERNAWVKVIRKSVEKEIEARVRQALGTPPRERQRKRLEELTTKRLAKIEEEKLAMTTSILNTRSALERRNEEEEELMWLRRQKYLEKFNRRRTMRCQSSYTNLNSVKSRPTNTSADDGIPTSQHSPVIWKACESIPSYLPDRQAQFKRPFIKPASSNANVEDVASFGPYFPSGRVPCMAAPRHLQAIPNFIEDLNIPEKNVGAPKVMEHPDYPKCWKGSVIVFDTERKSTLDPDAVPPGCPPHLQFESRFECGNLRQAKRIGNFEYELVLNTDLYTKRHTQWYYFQVRKTVPNVTYTFTIINFLKKDSLYNHGMKPLFYSEKTVEKENVGWTRTGHHISYYQNYIKGHSLLSREYIYFSLTFQMEFPHVNDVCYLAHCYPYTYTDLEIYLRNINADPFKSRYCKQQVLCKTIAGNNCYLLTISSEESREGKLGVVITARVHPGETNASWMMKGLLDFLTSEDPVAENLRRKHVFKIVPMVNPDGVIVGNYRTNLAARDLNRTYMKPRKETSPTVYQIKKLVESFSSRHEIVIYCDLHGHSRKPNVFMYGCTPSNRGATVKDFIHERLFPWLMSQKAPGLFSFRECKFKVRKCKESTARVVMWRQMGVTNSFTMEATFCGANFGDISKGRHFHCGDFESMGQHFCEVLKDYTEARPRGCNSDVTEAYVEMAWRMTQDIIQHARLLQFDKNEASCSASHVERQGQVNVFDVHVEDAKSASECEEVQVSVRKTAGATFEDCIHQLEQFDMDALCAESDSSDSDSQTEDEDGGTTNSKQSKKNGEKDRKKKKKKPMKRWEVLATLKQKSEMYNKEKEESVGKKSSAEMKNEKKKVRLNQGTFVNPYTARYNNGIPIYSQERIEERLRKRVVKDQDAEEECNQLPILWEDERQTGLPGVSGTVAYHRETIPTIPGEANLFRLPSQHNAACYVVSRGPGAARSPSIEVGTFQFEPLSDANSRAFAVHMPGKQPVRDASDGELTDCHEELLSYESLFAVDNLNTRNTAVTLGPLQYSQSTACAYDLSKLSKPRHERVRRDESYEEHHSPGRNGPIHEPILRSESKMRSLSKLKHLSLDVSAVNADNEHPDR